MLPRIPVFALLLTCLCAPLAAYAAPIATTVRDLGGTSHAIPNRSQKATVLLFLAHDCPISNSYAPEINRIAAEYGKSIQFLAVYAESGLSQSAAQKHAREFGFKIPAVLDTDHRLSRATGATVTPEAAILAPDGRRLYLGRIDNRYVGYGKTRAQTTERDLRAALDAVLANRPIPQPVTRAVGCFIPEASSTP